MGFQREFQHSNEYESIIGIQFGVHSPEYIRNRSVCEVKHAIPYENGEPKIGGLFDPRMGVLDHGMICPTDKYNNVLCPGYFGHIELARPVFYVHFLPYVKKALSCICHKCSNLLIDTSLPVYSRLNYKKGQKRLDELYLICNKVRRCGEKNGEVGCGAAQPDKIIKDSVGKLIAEYRGEDKEVVRMTLTPEICLRMLKKLSDASCEKLGFNPKQCRPDWMICQVLPVAPPCVRPSVNQDNNQRSEDDLTHKLVDIIKANQSLAEKMNPADGEPAHPDYIDHWHSVLQYHVATLVDNDLPGANPSGHRTGRPLKAIRQRLGSKEGRIRNNLMGKRVDFSARSVITPAANLAVDELGVPQAIAQRLTYPEVVTAQNIEALSALVKTGPDGYPGAVSVMISADGSTRSLAYLNRDVFTLSVGDILHRHLMDGDYVLFNRQPSLHRMSMMAHRVKVLPYHTFRLNVSATTPYNADFDKVSVENRRA